MSQKPSTSKKRIIPIQIERRDEPEIIENKNTKTEKVGDSFTDSDLENSVPSQDDTNIKFKGSLPPYNTKEKIVFVVDSAEDENFTHFKYNNTSQKPLSMLKRVIEIFVRGKHLIDPKHEYALVVLNENSAFWVTDFTNDVNEIIEFVQNIESCDTEDIFDLNSLFEVILDHVEIPGENEVDEILMPPPYVVRTILLYARSYTVPKLCKTPEVQKLLESPYFTFDVLMTHEPVGVDNNCSRIFEILEKIDTKGFAYFFAAARDTKILHESMAKLLGHPLQRPVQKLANYTLKES